MPVGCAVMKDGEKITDPNLSYKIGLYFPNKKPDEMVTKDASASSKWHGFGNLPRANKTKHFLGMTVTDRNNNRPEETVYFPVKDLQLDNPEIPFNLVGGYESANPYDYSKIISEQLKRVLGNAVTYDNKTSPILPLGACSHGVKRDQYDLTQYSDPIMQVSAFAGKLGESANIDALKQKQSLKEGSMRLKAVDCFVLAKEAGPSSWSKVIGTPRPVLEGEGCLFLQSPMGIVIYDKPQIEKYNIKKEFLETYVKARMCPDAK
jgi:hypothetical protein